MIKKSASDVHKQNKKTLIEFVLNFLFKNTNIASPLAMMPTMMIKIDEYIFISRVISKNLVEDWCSLQNSDKIELFK